MADLIYPELSYKLLGLSFKVFNENGYGLSEKFYQAALANLLNKERIEYKREQKLTITSDGDVIGRYFVDFLIENKLILELKVRPQTGYVHIKQVMGYLKSAGLKLAIIIYFTREGVKYRRVINLN